MHGSMMMACCVVCIQTVLAEAGVVADSIIRASVGFKEFPASQGGWRGNFYAASCPCTQPQTVAGQATFFSTLYCVSEYLVDNAEDTHKLLTVIREITTNLPLVFALQSLSQKKSLRGATALANVFD
jgi:hypothetical protein